MTTIGYATLQVIPSVRGISGTISRSLTGLGAAGRTAGQDLARGITMGLDQAQAGVTKAQRAHERYAEAVRSSTARVAIEERKLQELRNRGITTGSQYMAQQERLNAANRRLVRSKTDVQRATGDLTRAQQRLTEAQVQGGAAAGTAGRGFTALGHSIKGVVGVAAATGGLLSLGAAVNSAMRSGLDFTNALNTMQSVSGASAAEVAKVSAEARKLGTDSQLAATSSTDAANAMLELAKGGFTVDQSMQAARGTLQLAAAAQISAADAATIQSQALQAFGLDAGYAGKAADILANAANASSAEITDVALALQQSGTVANQFGLDMTDTAAAIALLANAGIKGSDAGTLLKSTLLALTDQSDQAETIMKQLGLTVYDAQGRFVGLESLFGQLHAASERMTDQQYQQATAILFGSDAMRLSGLAAQVGADGFNQMRAAMDKNGSAAEVAAAKMQGLPGAWEALKNTAQDAGLAFYDAVDGPLTAAANLASDTVGLLVSQAQRAGSDLGSAFDNPQVQDQLSRLKDDTSTAFVGLGREASALGPVLSDLLTTAATVGAAIGTGAWQVLVTALQAAGTALSVVTPLLSTVGDLVSSNKGVVVAFAAGFLLLKTVPPIMTRVVGTVTALGVRAAATAASMHGLATATGRVVQAGTMGSVTMGRFGSVIGQVGERAPLIARMQQSFVTAAAGAQQFGRTAGVAAAAGTGLRAAGSAVAGVFGGPLGLALAGVAAGTMLVAAEMSEAKTAARNLDEATKSAANSQRSLKEALSKSQGSLANDSSMSALTASMEAYQAQVHATAETHQSAYEQYKSLKWGDHSKEFWAAEDAISTRAAFQELGYTSEELARKVSGSVPEYMKLRGELLALGENGRLAATDMGTMRARLLLQQESARRVSPGMIELGDAISAMGDKGVSSSDKLSKLKAAMDALNPARSKTEAMAQYGETIRQMGESVAGIDSSAFKGGQLDAMATSGGNLSRTLGELADKAAQVASTGGDMSTVAAENEKVFAQLATATDQPIEKIRELYGELGGRTVDLTVALSGKDEAVQGIGKVYAAFKAQPDKKVIELEATDVNGEAARRLDEMGIKVSKIPGTSRVRVEALTDDAKVRLEALIGTITAVPPGKAINVTAPGGDSILAMLREMGARVHTDNNKNIVVDAPLAPAVLEQLRALGVEVQTNNGKTILVRADDIDYRTKLPKWTQTEYKKIIVEAAGQGISPAVPGMPGVAGPVPQANGSIRAYAQGGIAELEPFANGGQRLTQPAMLPGRGAGQLYVTAAGPAIAAEGETKTESWIPWALSKRSRATRILEATARAFGYQLIPEGMVPDGVSKAFGAVAGGLTSTLVKSTGVDGIRKFADGGISVLDSLVNIQKRVAPALQLTSGVRNEPGSFHNTGQAGDFSNGSSPTREMLGFAQYMAANYKPMIAELIYHDPAFSGQQIDEGQTVPDSFFANAGYHGNHTHIAAHQPLPWPPPTQAPAQAPAPSATTPAPETTTYPESPTPTTPESSEPVEQLPGDSISKLAGGVAQAAVEGQVADALGVFGVGDQPGWLSAIITYENSRREQEQRTSTGAQTTDPKSGQKGSWQKVKSVTEAEEDLATARRELDIAEQRQRELKPNAKPSDRMAREDRLTKARQKLRDAEADLSEAKANPNGRKWVPAPDANGQTPQAQTPNSAAPGAAPTPAPAPPVITDVPEGGIAAGTPGAKAAVHKVWSQRGWTGNEWLDTLRLGNGESGWRVDAQNPASGAYGLGQLLGEDKKKRWPQYFTPSAEAQAGPWAEYIDERYETPSNAWAFWQSQSPHWYDTGGGLPPGLTLAYNGLGHTETVVPRTPEDVFATLDAAIDSIRRVMADGDGGGRGGTVINNVTHATFRDEDEYYRQERRRARMGMMQKAGGRAAVMA
ncbi:tape measure protein [Gordonia phage Dmitri]|nr:tape measure protein [Gordonia phage Dmitri]